MLFLWITPPPLPPLALKSAQTCNVSKDAFVSLTFINPSTLFKPLKYSDNLLSEYFFYTDHHNNKLSVCFFKIAKFVDYAIC